MLKKIIFITISVFFLTGCTNKYFVCNANIKNSDMNYKLEAKYKIYYNNNYVTKIEKEEIYTSEDKKIIDYFDDYKALELSNSNDLYGGFEYKIDSTLKKVKINTIIDLNAVDIKKMVNNNYLDEDYVIGNKLTTTGARYYYKERGAICGE